VGVITLITDFGLEDGYVGTMKGVILSIAPQAVLIDISHEIAPGDIREAAFVLYTAYPYFPEGTIHLIVVDPGVGSERRVIAVRTPRAYFVTPDNGVLSYVLAREPVKGMVNLTSPRYWLPEVGSDRPVAPTFHGRDVFAPAAAYLAKGIPLDDLGEPLDEIVTFPLSRPRTRPDGTIVGHILHIDRFGNLITDVESQRIKARSGEGMTIEIAGQTINGLGLTFSSVGEGELVAYLGSAGYLEVAVRGGDAAQALGMKVRDEVVIRWKSS